LSVDAMLPFLGVLHAFCAWRIIGVGGSSTPANLGKIPSSARPEKSSKDSAPNESPWTILRHAPYLRNLAILVLLTAVSKGSLDYVFKAHAAQAYGSGASLLRFFAIFYTVIGFGTFLAQTVLSRRALEALGLARTVGSFPLVVGIGSAGAALIPGLASATLAQGLGSITNDSLF